MEREGRMRPWKPVENGLGALSGYDGIGVVLWFRAPVGTPPYDIEPMQLALKAAAREAAPMIAKRAAEIAGGGGGRDGR